MSFEDIEGTVNEYQIKGGTGKNGKPYAFHNVIVDGVMYQNGFDPIDPAPKQGDLVKIRFTTEQNGKYTNRTIKAFKIVAGAADNPNKGNTKVPSGGGDLGAAWGNASNVAATVFAALVEAEAIPLSAKGTKGNTAKRFDEAIEIFDKLRVKLFKDSQDIQRVLDQHADFGEVETNEPQPIPDGTVPDEDGDDFEDDIPF